MIPLSLFSKCKSDKISAILPHRLNITIFKYQNVRINVKSSFSARCSTFIIHPLDRNIWQKYSLILSQKYFTIFSIAFYIFRFSEIYIQMANTFSMKSCHSPIHSTNLLISFCLKGRKGLSINYPLWHSFT